MQRRTVERYASASERFRAFVAERGGGGCLNERGTDIWVYTHRWFDLKCKHLQTSAGCQLLRYTVDPKVAQIGYTKDFRYRPAQIGQTINAYILRHWYLVRSTNPPGLPVYFRDLDLWTYHPEKNNHFVFQYNEYLCKFWFKSFRLFASSYRVRKIFMAIAKWPWPLIAWPWIPPSSGSSWSGKRF